MTKLFCHKDAYKTQLTTIRLGIVVKINDLASQPIKLLIALRRVLDNCIIEDIAHIWVDADDRRYAQKR